MPIRSASVSLTSLVGCVVSLKRASSNCSCSSDIRRRVLLSFMSPPSACGIAMEEAILGDPKGSGGEGVSLAKLVRVRVVLAGGRMTTEIHNSD